MESRNEISVSLKAGGSCVDIRPLFSFDSNYIFVPSGWLINVYSTKSGECIKILNGHRSKIVSLHQNPSNKVQIISCSEDGILIYWDYEDGINLKTDSIPNELTPVATCFIVEKKTRLFISKLNSTGGGTLYSCFPVNSKVQKSKPQSVFDEVNLNQHSVSFSNGDFVVGIHDNFLCVFVFKGGRLRHMGSQPFTCVVSHPKEHLVATGDVLGRIVIWGNVTQSLKPTRSIYHWHTLPVADLAFSSEGNYLYSGGGECVLLKWNLQAEDKVFVPRMGLPICQISVAPDNSFIATSHEDNAIFLLNPQNQIVQCFQGLCQGHPFKDLSNVVSSPVPTGIIYDPKNRCLVLNGKPGHVQFYSHHLDKQLFSLDISNQNFVTQERERVIANTIVENVALNSNSKWMATVQCRDDHETSLEIVLKFWKFNNKTQSYSLNTTVLLPHNQRINKLIFQPNEDLSPLVASTSNDGKFKIWSLEEKDQMSSDGKTPKSTWQCITMGYYRDHPAGDADFSEDGSLLAIAFSHAATLWVPENAGLKAILSVPVTDNNCENIRQLEFGQQNCCHLLVTTTNHALTIWDVVTLAIQWQVEMNVNYLVKNPESEIMAVFNQEHTLFVFNPSNPTPVHISENVAKSDIIASVFVPENDVEDEKSTSFLNKFSLYFMNKEQELMVMSLNSRQTSLEPQLRDTMLKGIKPPKTQFGALIAQKKRTEVHKFKSEHQFFQRGKLREKMFQELLNIPSHAVPPIRTLCSDFMSSLLIERSEDKK